nr:unnamed protein product [Digitaria exilis]
MPSIRAPASKQTATLQVAVKCRPLTDTEQRRARHIIQTVVVLDPDLSKDYLDLIQNRTKERRYTFDHVYAPACSNSDVYKNISSTIAGVVQGLNATVFAYGSTGRSSGHLELREDPEQGIIVAGLRSIKKNIGTLDTHVEDYQKMIDNLQVEVSQLKKELAEKEHQLSAKPTEKAADSVNSRI